jgi:hypothetical protein
MKEKSDARFPGLYDRFKALTAQEKVTASSLGPPQHSPPLTMCWSRNSVRTTPIPYSGTAGLREWTAALRRPPPPPPIPSSSLLWVVKLFCGFSVPLRLVSHYLFPFLPAQLHCCAGECVCAEWWGVGSRRLRRSTSSLLSALRISLASGNGTAPCLLA